MDLRGWMDLLRTAATLGGFGLAVMAYRKWRRPDDAKRRADTAELIIKQSHSVETVALDARIGTLVVDFSGEPISVVRHRSVTSWQCVSCPLV